jgi:hypothetical protein
MSISDGRKKKLCGSTMIPDSRMSSCSVHRGLNGGMHVIGPSINMSFHSLLITLLFIVILIPVVMGVSASRNFFRYLIS